MTLPRLSQRLVLYRDSTILAGISILSFRLAQKHIPAAFSFQAQITMPLVG